MTVERGAASLCRLRAGVGLLLALAGHSFAAVDTLITTDALTTWAEATFPPLLDRHAMSGAVVSVVKDGRLVLARGFGSGDVAGATPADPERTRVRIGSVTKTFTATLIAQLIEEGRIGSVDDAVNDYLTRIQLPDNAGTPITLRHLLTHSAGFEDRFFNIGTVAPVTVPATPVMMERLRPAYVRPPGQRIVYSNYGVAVLGWLIEDVTGDPIELAVRRRLFEPAGMTATELAVTPNAPADLAVPGLIDADGVIGAVPFTAINPAVAQTGSIVSTAADMARYLNAQLGHGFLSEALRQRLHRPLHDSGPGTTALAMTFFVDQWADRTVVSHGGNWAGFHSWLTLVPEDGLGMFVTVLGEPAPDGLAARLLRATLPDLAGPPSPALASASSIADGFLLHLYGPRRPLPQSQPVSPALAVAATGTYLPGRRAQTTAEALAALVFLGAGTLDVTVGSNALHVGGAGPWRHDGRSSFVLDAPTRPAFHLHHAADAAPTLIPTLGIYDFERIPAWQDPRWHALIVHAGIPLTVLGLLAAARMRRNAWVIAPVVVGAAGLVMLLTATIGLAPGHNLMTAYYAGEPARLMVFVGAANVQLLAAVATLPAAAGMQRGMRWLAVLCGVVALSVALVLWHYHALGMPRL